MSTEEKKNLLDMLTEAHLATLAVLENVDLEMPVYEDSGWRVRDILGHIATWDQETAKSINAYQVGSEYLVPNLDDDETDFNEKAVAEQKKLSGPQLLAEWEEAYKEFKKAIQDMPSDRFPGEMLFPWGDERGSIVTLAEYMIEHSDEHRAEIEKALKA